MKNRLMARVAASALLLASVSACAERKKSVDLGGGGGKVQSSHWDTGFVDLDSWLNDLFSPSIKSTPGVPARGTRQPAGSHPIELRAVGRIGFGHEWGGSGIVEYLGGLRLVNEKQFKYPIYGEVLGGWLHYSGFETVFTLRPSAGVFVPLKNSKYRLFVQAGLPFVFFDFFHEHGVEWRAGVAVPLSPK